MTTGTEIGPSVICLLTTSLHRLKYLAIFLCETPNVNVINIIAAGGSANGRFLLFRMTKKKRLGVQPNSCYAGLECYRGYWPAHSSSIAVSAKSAQLVLLCITTYCLGFC
jgi:hypothetical protein